MISASCDSSELLDLEEFMPWTEITRPDYDRRGLRYASDATDAEWELVAPFMPELKALGRPRETDLRTVWNAIQYIGATGCQWAMLPRDFPPFTTVQYYFYQMRSTTLWLRRRALHPDARPPRQPGSSLLVVVLRKPLPGSG